MMRTLEIKEHLFYDGKQIPELTHPASRLALLLSNRAARVF
jgi:hypothetical protein